ncbi:hypothetical protein EM6_1577 [Asticcacaulis excentricus]|uniref:Uncharacterized protein n=1 Tax=Asticcacaulis excentricus TaxID=78587 RepID=A0A3G9G755_9CAUL|nr:hypothetical protein EM6_1577 [Asticcacaulis excentricus]
MGLKTGVARSALTDAQGPVRGRTVTGRWRGQLPSKPLPATRL